MQKAPTENEPKLNRTIQMRIGRGLRDMYGALATEPVPDRLLGLLMQLEDRVAGKRAA
jgi:hypothetical protein